jgi:glutaredoxin-related protein
MSTCAFCLREGAPKLHQHHVIPKCKRGKEIVPTCGACGSFIHATWSHNQLRDDYNTVDKVVATPEYQRFLKWLLKQDSTAHFRSAKNNDRPAGKYK